ncbi:MAG: hypothetical protein WC758_01895 [Candidatus Woesearchaeota archaeon]|jgi:hypothetical protein
MNSKLNLQNKDTLRRDFFELLEQYTLLINKTKNHRQSPYFLKIKEPQDLDPEVILSFTLEHHARQIASSIDTLLNKVTPTTKEEYKIRDNWYNLFPSYQALLNYYDEKDEPSSFNSSTDNEKSIPGFSDYDSSSLKFKEDYDYCFELLNQADKKIFKDIAITEHEQKLKEDILYYIHETFSRSPEELLDNLSVLISWTKKRINDIKIHNKNCKENNPEINFIGIKKYEDSIETAKTHIQVVKKYLSD